MSEKICENCWQFEHPTYSQECGRCRLDNYKLNGNTSACDDFEDRNSNDEDE